MDTTIYKLIILVFLVYQTVLFVQPQHVQHAKKDFFGLEKIVLNARLILINVINVLLLAFVTIAHMDIILILQNLPAAAAQSFQIVQCVLVPQFVVVVIKIIIKMERDVSYVFTLNRPVALR
jgi:hypothetical protein